MKNIMKIAVLALAIVMAVACFAGCGEKKDGGASEIKGVQTEGGKVYKIVSDNAFAPFEYLDVTTNTYVGIDMDILAAIAEDQGFAYTMENIGFDAACNTVQAGNADAVIAGMTIKPERELAYDFSDGYFEDGQIMAVAKDSSIKDLEGIRGKTVAVKQGTMGADYANSIKDEYGLTILPFEGSVEMYQAVTSGTAVACFEDCSVVADAINSGRVALRTVGEVIDPSYYGFAVKKGQNPELIEMFNAGLKNIQNDGKDGEPSTYDKILAKYGITK